MATGDGHSDKLAGTLNKLKGEAKDRIGQATGDPDQQAEGKRDKLKGEVQKQVGNLKNKF